MFLYNDYTTWVAKTFGHKIQKIAIDASFTCPNRDGTKAGDGGRCLGRGAGEHRQRGRAARRA